MPHAIVIHCLAREPVEAGALNGGQLQGAFLDLVRNVDAELSAELHQGNTLRNYALSIIRPRPFDDFVCDSGPHKRQSRLREIGFRVACLDDRIYPAIARWAMKSDSSAGNLRFGKIDFQVTRVLVTSESGEPWAAYADYEQIVEGASDTETFIRLEFATPTCFSQGERQEPLPLPRHVFGGLARRWNAAFSDRLLIPIEPPGERGADEGFVKLIEERVVLAHPFEFRSAVTDAGDGRKITGFTGRATYRIIGRPGSAFIYFINLLADASFFMGLGKKTSRGCGALRRIE